MNFLLKSLSKRMAFVALWGGLILVLSSQWLSENHAIFLNSILENRPIYFLVLSLPLILSLTASILGLKIQQTRILLANLGFQLVLGFALFQISFQSKSFSNNHFALVVLAVNWSFISSYFFEESLLWAKPGVLRIMTLVGSILIFTTAFHHEKFIQLNIEIFNGLVICAFALSLLFIHLLKKQEERNFTLNQMISLMPFYAVLIFWQIEPIFFSRLEKSPEIFLALSSMVFPLFCIASVISLFWKRVYLDGLTEIPNRRALNEKLMRLRGDYTLAMIDIDHFKSFNTQFGHEEGDHVLRYVAKTLKEETGDLAFRYGGEEFCLVFEKTGSEMAEVISEAIRKKLSKKKFVIRNKKRNPKFFSSNRFKDLFHEIKRWTSPFKEFVFNHPFNLAPFRDNWSWVGGKVTTVGPLKKRTKRGKKNIQVTISVGVAEPAEKKPESTQDVLVRADQALYQAKKGGRNCVVVAA